jgi:hypothetical protein
VFTAVAHQASKELRRRRRRPTAPLENVAAVADGGPSPEERADQTERSRLTRDLLASLPRRRRAVMLLRYGWGLDPSQVCELIEGLSPRAYRKEITKGVDQLTERLRLVENGEWCADREPVLKAFAAGLADAEQELQAQQHLSHCRHCADFVGKLSGHLHDMGGSLVAPVAIDAIDDGQISLLDRVAEFADRARDGAGALISRGGSSAADPAASTLTGGARGAGAAGMGAAAKLAGLGTAGKVAVACLTGGAAATVCVAAGVGPVSSQKDEKPRVVVERAAEPRDRPVRTGTPDSRLRPVENEAGPAAKPADPDEGGGSEGPGDEPPVESDPVEPPPPPPPDVAEFGLAPSAGGGGTGGAGGSGGSSGSKAQAGAREFGP